MIGGRTGGSRHGWDGLVDNVRLSSTALDEKSLVIKGETVRPHTLAFYQFEKDGSTPTARLTATPSRLWANRTRHRPSRDSRNTATCSSMPTGSCTLIDMRTQLSTELSEASRREFLLRGAGFGALALTGMLARDQAFAATNPHAAKQPHFAPTKRVIFLFMEGGPSHMDLFDPKPLIQKLAGQRMPDSFKRPITAMGEAESPILASQRQWKRHGQSGLWISDWLPHTAECADDLAVIRSCWTNGINHSGGVCQMNTGQPSAADPAWARG